MDLACQSKRGPNEGPSGVRERNDVDPTRATATLTSGEARCPEGGPELAPPPAGAGTARRAGVSTFST